MSNLAPKLFCEQRFLRAIEAFSNTVLYLSSASFGLTAAFSNFAHIENLYLKLNCRACLTFSRRPGNGCNRMHGKGMIHLSSPLHGRLLGPEGLYKSSPKTPCETSQRTTPKHFRSLSRGRDRLGERHQQGRFQRNRRRLCHRQGIGLARCCNDVGHRA